MASYSNARIASGVGDALVAVEPFAGLVLADLRS
jgi:hypothetical protein